MSEKPRTCPAGHQLESITNGYCYKCNGSPAPSCSAGGDITCRIRPLLVSGQIGKDQHGLPVILINSEQSEEEQNRAFWHEIVHLCHLWSTHDEESIENLGLRLAEAFPITKQNQKGQRLDE